LAEPLRVADWGEWVRWLAAHKAETREVWLAIRKKRSKLPGVGIEDAIDEAIAHGWIDGQMRPLDADEYLLRFTPRRDESPWSLRNRRVAERLIAEGRMTEAGLACVEAAKRNGKWDSAYSSLAPPRVPVDFEAALRGRGAWDRFTTMSNSAQLQYIFWIDQAKRPETRARRIAEAVKRLIQDTD
jgi:uncharacterized protein YdeI (YjbR/CyaY-like superfamily)